MNPVNIHTLFNADKYHRDGNSPWTFFAYPTSLAGEHGLPPDDEAVWLLGELQERGIPVGIWVSEIVENTTFYACPREDIQRVRDAVDERVKDGTLEIDFCARRSECLFSLLSTDT